MFKSFLRKDGGQSWSPSPFDHMEPVVDTPSLPYAITDDSLNRKINEFLEKGFTFESHNAKKPFTRVRWSQWQFVKRILGGFFHHKVLHGVHAEQKHAIFGRANKGIRLSLTMRFGMDNLYIYRQELTNLSESLYVGIWYKNAFHGVETVICHEPISDQA